MKKLLMSAVTAIPCFLALSCGDSGPSRPTPSTTTAAVTTSVPVSQFEIMTLLTVYARAADSAMFTEGTMTDEALAMTILGVDDIRAGTTVLDNEERRTELQAAIERVNESFTDDDFQTAFGDSKENLRRFFNDADNDGWNIDGRHGEGRDWPHDGPNNGNDPDGWTAQMITTVTRR